MFGEPPDEKQIQDCVVMNQSGLITPSEHLTNVSRDLEFSQMNPELQELHITAIAVLSELENRPECLDVLAYYCSAIELADLREVMDLFEEIGGAEQISTVARGNYIKQADRLLVSAKEILENGTAVVRNYGVEKKLNAIEEIINALQEIVADMQEIRDTVKSRSPETEIESLRNEILSKLEKYMFDGSNLELHKSKQFKVAVLAADADLFAELLAEEKIVSGSQNNAEKQNSNLLKRDLPGYTTSSVIDERIAMLREGDRTTDNIFLESGEISQVVVIHVPDKHSLEWDYQYTRILLDWIRLPYKDRPKVIMYTDGFEPPLYRKHTFQGFLFCSTPDELRNVMTLAENLVSNQGEELYNTVNLEEGQRKAYNNSDLREWEEVTAEKRKSIDLITERISYRNNLVANYHKLRYSNLLASSEDRNETTWATPEDNRIRPERKIKSILDLGGGEGRIDIELVRRGLNLVNLDLSSVQLERSYSRVEEEVRATNSSDSKLINSVDEVNEHYLRVEGSFFNLEPVLNKALVEWKVRFPKTDPYDFFGTNRYDEYALSDPNHMFADVGFDMAMFNWHTFCEAGSPENQKDVLEQILNVLWPGGELVLEIPDRKFEPYASALRSYHEVHPDEPYGTIRDRKPDDFDQDNPDRYYPPRYFPDINEIVLLLKSVGFEINDADIQTYLVESKDLGGKRTMTLKEHFITARKSKA